MRRVLSLLVACVVVGLLVWPSTSEAASFRVVKQVASSSLVVKEQMTARSQTIDTLSRGDFVTVFNTSGEWAQVLVGSHIGYVKAAYLTVPSSTIKIASSKGGLVVKAHPMKGTKTLAVLQYKMIVEDFGQVGENWSFVQYGNITGYVASNFIGTPKTTTQFIHNAAGEPVRNIASSSGYVKGTIVDRMKVKVHSTLAGWSYVTQGDVRGYVRSKHLMNSVPSDKVTYFNGILFVNKEYPLPITYNPGVDKAANAALATLFKDAEKAGYRLKAVSTFRSYAYQTTVYNRNVKKSGQAIADRYSARPGHSEHQSGLAFDIGEIGREDVWLEQAFGQTNAGKWLADNAHLYGFIIRYPLGKEHITGYMYEPWHLRYVGPKVAKEVKKADTTLEEYIGVQ